MNREPKETALAKLAQHVKRTDHLLRRQAARPRYHMGRSGCKHSGDGHERLRKTVCRSPERADVLLEWLGV
ncbi:hypothetical protein A8D95_38625 [Burkholderia cenocepacia]|uniref:Uncharacterized protein n=1 Tax=Burkholderia cenocepacia TaxID=95486 RepID=A0A1V2Y2Z9_9BURK|nr:hypothetical protein A8D61_21535 [Burkholderia cenocepacia]OXI73737.1 hypothetical protein CFB81_10690 [Burkholderia sp. AU28863]AQQ26089.1 hypothetical protein A8E88_10685 [Burkholderia cenocepacia]AQQ32834.1 hypothetical protein A8E96_10555 [Burkholderia cenocepacia]AQQ42949.1 hypothetical protein A8E75_28885 [Burkholderia cenocepacia]